MISTPRHIWAPKNSQCVTHQEHDRWWLATIGHVLFWARLRKKPSGIAEILDFNGNRLIFDSVDSARAALFDAEFVAYDGLDEADALDRGFSLQEILPPNARCDEQLLSQMQTVLGTRV